MKEAFAFLIRNWQIPTFLVIAIGLLAFAGGAFAEGPQFTGNCNTISWQANPASENVVGYNVYLNDDAPVLAEITSINCSALNTVTGQNSVTVSAINMAGEGVPSDPVPFEILPPIPTQVQGVQVQ